MQTDIKRVLAYSTISQLGYMFLAVGVGAYSAAIFHMITHAFFKALLFLGAGSVIHGMHDEQDMRAHGRAAQVHAGHRGHVHRRLARDRGRHPVRRLLVEGRDPRQGVVPATTTALWAVGVVAALLTAFYMTRQVWLVFYGNERWHATPSAAGVRGRRRADADEADADGARRRRTSRTSRRGS